MSHDLRTPITRLKLRSEFIEDDGHRTQTLRDLDQMHAMLEAVLSFLQERPQRRAFHANRSVCRAAADLPTSSPTPAAMFATKVRNT